MMAPKAIHDLHRVERARGDRQIPRQNRLAKSFQDPVLFFAVDDKCIELSARIVLDAGPRPHAGLRDAVAHNDRAHGMHASHRAPRPQISLARDTATLASGFTAVVCR